MARPSKLSPEVIVNLTKALSVCSTYKMAAEYAGIGESTFSLWRKNANEARIKRLRGQRLSKRDKELLEFLDQIKLAESKGAIANLSLIQKAAKQDWKAAAWLMERRHNYTRQNNISNEESREEADFSPIMLLKIQIKELRQAGKKALTMGSYQAYAALQRQTIQCLLELRNQESEQGSDLEQYSDNEIMEQISNLIISLPPILRQQLHQDLEALSSSKIVALVNKK